MTMTTPYPLRKSPLCPDGKKPSSSTLTSHLLNTLSDARNPITHSDIYQRSDTVVSATTGHQRGEGRTPHGVSARAYFQDHPRKLSLQRTPDHGVSKPVLGNMRIYIDGYLSGTTDIEMKSIITRAGGTISSVPSDATQIITSRPLSGSKTHKMLTTRSRHPAHVVKPEWIIDSINAGRRLKESQYSLIQPSSTRSIVDIFKSGRS